MSAYLRQWYIAVPLNTLIGRGWQPSENLPSSRCITVPNLVFLRQKAWVYTGVPKNWSTRVARTWADGCGWTPGNLSITSMSILPPPSTVQPPTGPTIIPPRLNIWQDNLSRGGFFRDGDCHVFVRVSGGIAEPNECPSSNSHSYMCGLGV